jgi:type I restriction enzyme S subunit
MMSSRRRLSEVTTKRSKAGWTTVAFGDVVRQVKDKIDPDESGLERYVAGEHMDTDDLRIRRWGEIGDGYLGPAFHMRFKPGQVLYGSRRTYLRKVAVPDFEGITANTTYVLEPKDPSVLSPELLPFIMQTEAFNQHSVRESKGSVNPYVNFSDLAWYEFALPPIEEQERLATLLRHSECAEQSLRQLLAATETVFRSTIDALLRLPQVSSPRIPVPSAGWAIAELQDLTDPSRPISYGILKPGLPDPNGVPMLRVLDIDDYGCRTRTVPMTVSRSVADTSKTTYLRPNDVLISVMATIGRVFVVPDDMRGWNVNRALAVLPGGGRVSSDYIETFLQSAFVRRLFDISRIGSAQQRINLELLKALPVPVPPLEIRERAVTARRQLAAASASCAHRLRDLQDLKRRLFEDGLTR